MFFVFSSALNIIQPRLLESMQVERPSISRIEDYLTGRTQFVRLQSCVSECEVSNIGVNNLELNIPETKEIVEDFRCSPLSNTWA